MRWSSLFHLKSFYDPLMMYLGRTGNGGKFPDFGIKLLISHLNSGTFKFPILAQVT